MARTITEIDGKRYEVRKEPGKAGCGLCALNDECLDMGVPCIEYYSPEYYFVRIDDNNNGQGEGDPGQGQVAEGL